MFEGNSLSVKYHLRDLERQMTPRLGQYPADDRALKFRPYVTLLAYAIVALTLGAAYIA